MASSIILNTSLISLLAATGGMALAQTRELAPREANIWSGKDHQPTETEVTQQEKSAGIAVSPQQQRATDDELQTIYRELMGGSRKPQQ